MEDPLSQIVRLLRPRAAFANIISGKGNWAVRYSAYGLPSFCIMLEGSCRLAVDGEAPITIAAGDFVLLPTTPAFTLSSFAPAPPVHWDPKHAARIRGELRYGRKGGAPGMRSLGGAFLFDSADPGLLVSLLPTVVHVRESVRLAQLVQMVREETVATLPGSEFTLSRIGDLLLVEALRAVTLGDAPTGMLRGLGDPQLAPVLSAIHARVNQDWSVEQMAKLAAMSRSAFFERFARLVGVAPMEYLARWRIEVAKGLLREGTLSVAEVAERVGYGTTSAFSVAFRRVVGRSPREYLREG